MSRSIRNYLCGCSLAMRPAGMTGMKCGQAWMALVLVVTAAVFSACGERPLPVSVQPIPVGERVLLERAGTIHFDVKYVDRRGRRLAKPAAAVDTMTAYVYEPTNERLAQMNLNRVVVVGDSIRGETEIEVRAGNNRKVDLVAYGKQVGDQLVQWFGADNDVDVPAGGETQAEIVMRRMAPVLELPIGTTGQYLLRWNRLPEAENGRYFVEEVDSTTTSASTSSISDTSMIFESKVGTYFYRVQAGNIMGVKGYGSGGWSNIVQVTVKADSWVAF